MNEEQDNNEEQSISISIEGHNLKYNAEVSKATAASILRLCLASQDTGS